MSKAKYTALVEDKEKWQSEAGSLSNKFQASRAENRKLVEIKERLYKETVDQAADIKNQHNVIKTLNEQVDNQTTKVKALSANVNKLTARKNEIWNDLKKAEETCEDLKSKYDLKRAEAKGYKTTIADMIHQQEAIASDLKNCKERNDVLRNMVEVHEKQAQELKDKLAEAEKTPEFIIPMAEDIQKAVDLINSVKIKLPDNVKKALKLLQKHTVSVVEEPINDEVSRVVRSVVVKKSAQPGLSITCKAAATLAESNNEIDAEAKQAYKRSKPGRKSSNK